MQGLQYSLYAQEFNSKEIRIFRITCKTRLSGRMEFGISLYIDNELSLIFILDESWIWKQIVNILFPQLKYV